MMEWQSSSALAIIFALASGAGWTQTVTVSQNPGDTPDFTSIQAAIDSLEPGGSNDDLNPLNNVVQILDSALYDEPLTITGTGMTLEGVQTGANRPRLTAQQASTAAGYILDTLADEPIVIRNLIFLPHLTNPTTRGLRFDEAAVDYDVTLEDLLVAGNNGSNQPTSQDGRTQGTAVARFGDDAVDLNSTAAGTPDSDASLTRVIITNCTGGTDPTPNDALRALTDGGTISINEGCVFSFVDRGIQFSSTDGTAISFNGTQANPIIIHGCQREAISALDADDPGTVSMTYVSITGNSTAHNGPAINEDYTGTATLVWTNVTIAGNSMTDSAATIASDVVDVESPNLAWINCILAGDGSLSATTYNTLDLQPPDNNPVCTGSCIVLSGPHSLNVTGAADGLVGTTTPTGTFIGNDPNFITLNPANPDYIRVNNPVFFTAGPSGGQLNGAGPSVVPVELSVFRAD